MPGELTGLRTSKMVFDTLRILAWEASWKLGGLLVVLGGRWRALGRLLGGLGFGSKYGKLTPLGDLRDTKFTLRAPPNGNLGVPKAPKGVGPEFDPAQPGRPDSVGRLPLTCGANPSQSSPA